MLTQFTQLSKCLNYEFSDKQLLLQALTHRSVGACNNERLEFLGDSVLNFVITEQLYGLRPAADEGDLSRIRASLVRGDTLAKLAKEIHLEEHLRLGQGEMRSGGARRKSILADAMEAIFGAVLLDGGLEPCKRLILALYADRLRNLPSAEGLKDAKTRLQEYLQGSGRPLPVYQIQSESGKDHAKQFEVSCEVGEQRVSATGTSRRKAEQTAAGKMLDILQPG